METVAEPMATENPFAVLGEQMDEVDENEEERADPNDPFMRLEKTKIGMGFELFEVSKDKMNLVCSMEEYYIGSKFFNRTTDAKLRIRAGITEVCKLLPKLGLARVYAAMHDEESVIEIPIPFEFQPTEAAGEQSFTQHGVTFVATGKLLECGLFEFSGIRIEIGSHYLLSLFKIARKQPDSNKMSKQEVEG